MLIMTHATARLHFLSELISYRCLTIRQCDAVGLASMQMARKYVRELVREKLVSITPFQTEGNNGRPENLILPTPKGLKSIGSAGKPIEQRLFAHQYYLNWCRIRLGALEQFGLQVQFYTRPIGDLWPDGTLVLRSKKRNKSLLFFVEMDMGTESLSGELQSKVLAYQGLFRSGAYTELGPSFHGFRVLFVFSDRNRLRGFTRLCERVGPCLFVWSAAFESLDTSGAAAPIWYRGSDVEQQLSTIGSLAPTPR